MLCCPLAVPQVQKRPKAKTEKSTKSKAGQPAKIEIPGLEDLPEGELEISEDAPLEGYLGLATFGGEAEFDEVTVTDAVSGKTLLTDAFERPLLDSGRWRDVEGQARGGFFRIVNFGNEPAAFNCRLAFHRDPWKRLVPHQPAKLPGKQASACAPGLRLHRRLSRGGGVYDRSHAMRAAAATEAGGCLSGLAGALHDPVAPKSQVAGFQRLGGWGPVPDLL